MPVPGDGLEEDRCNLHQLPHPWFFNMHNDAFSVLCKLFCKCRFRQLHSVLHPWGSCLSHSHVYAVELPRNSDDSNWICYMSGSIYHLYQPVSCKTPECKSLYRICKWIRPEGRREGILQVSRKEIGGRGSTTARVTWKASRVAWFR